MDIGTFRIPKYRVAKAKLMCRPGCVGPLCAVPLGDPLSLESSVSRFVQTLQISCTGSEDAMRCVVGWCGLGRYQVLGRH